jgi:hypothetical protein
MDGGMGNMFEGRVGDLLIKATEVLSQVNIPAVMQTILLPKIS